MQFTKFGKFFYTVDGKTYINSEQGTTELEENAVRIGKESIRKWQFEKCPFYRMYPGVVESFESIKFDSLKNISFDLFKNGFNVAIELPVGYEIEESGFSISAFLLTKRGESISVSCQAEKDGISAVYFVLLPERIISEYNDSDFDTPLRKLVRFIAGICLLDNNPDLVKPIVLGKDVVKYEQTHDEKYVDKAVRRGVKGWDIGKDIPTRQQVREAIEQAKKEGKETGYKVAPHIRAPHLQKVWTGPGKKVPKIVRIDTILVNWKDIETLPTGYYNK